jgi:hypothetical protein
VSSSDPAGERARQKMSKNLKIRIGEVCISIEGDAQMSDWEIAPAYRPFIWPGEADIKLRLHRGLPDTPGGEKVFDCPPIWTLYRQNGASIIRIFDRLSGLERILVLPRHLEKTDLYFADKSGPFLDPFYGPTMELLMVNYLARGRGVIIHSCGIARNGRGILFVGESGAGKSTLARMWDQEKNGFDVLSDDRTIVRKKGHHFWMYGTPWHGDAKFGSPRGVRLERIFFLRHGQKNSINELKGIDPVSQLLTCSFPPYWDPQGMAFTLEVFTDLSAQVPCQQLTFKPERSTLDLVERIAT